MRLKMNALMECLTEYRQLIGPISHIKHITVFTTGMTIPL